MCSDWRIWAGAIVYGGLCNILCFGIDLIQSKYKTSIVNTDTFNLQNQLT